MATIFRKFNVARRGSGGNDSEMQPTASCCSMDSDLYDSEEASRAISSSSQKKAPRSGKANGLMAPVTRMFNQFMRHGDSSNQNSTANLHDVATVDGGRSPPPSTAGTQSSRCDDRKIPGGFPTDSDYRKIAGGFPTESDCSKFVATDKNTFIQEVLNMPLVIKCKKDLLGKLLEGRGEQVTAVQRQDAQRDVWQFQDTLLTEGWAVAQLNWEMKLKEAAEMQEKAQQIEQKYHVLQGASVREVTALRDRLRKLPENTQEAIDTHYFDPCEHLHESTRALVKTCTEETLKGLIADAESGREGWLQWMVRSRMAEERALIERQHNELVNELPQLRQDVATLRAELNAALKKLEEERKVRDDLESQLAESAFGLSENLKPEEMPQVGPQFGPAPPRNAPPPSPARRGNASRREMMERTSVSDEKGSSSQPKRPSSPPPMMLIDRESPLPDASADHNYVCPACGSSCGPKHRFCASCGSPISQQAPIAEHAIDASSERRLSNAGFIGERRTSNSGLLGDRRISNSGLLGDRRISNSGSLGERRVSNPGLPALDLQVSPSAGAPLSSLPVRRRSSVGVLETVSEKVVCCPKDETADTNAGLEILGSENSGRIFWPKLDVDFLHRVGAVIDFEALEVAFKTQDEGQTSTIDGALHNRLVINLDNVLAIKQDLLEPVREDSPTHLEHRITPVLSGGTSSALMAHAAKIFKTIGAEMINAADLLMTLERLGEQLDEEVLQEAAQGLSAASLALVCKRVETARTETAALRSFCITLVGSIWELSQDASTKGLQQQKMHLIIGKINDTVKVCQPRLQQCYQAAHEGWTLLDSMRLRLKDDRLSSLCEESEEGTAANEEGTAANSCKSWIWDASVDEEEIRIDNEQVVESSGTETPPSPPSPMPKRSARRCKTAPSSTFENIDTQSPEDDSMCFAPRHPVPATLARQGTCGLKGTDTEDSSEPTLAVVNFDSTMEPRKDETSVHSRWHLIDRHRTTISAMAGSAPKAQHQKQTTMKPDAKLQGLKVDVVAQVRPPPIKRTFTKKAGAGHSPAAAPTGLGQTVLTGHSAGVGHAPQSSREASNQPAASAQAELPSVDLQVMGSGRKTAKEVETPKATSFGSARTTPSPRRPAASPQTKSNAPAASQTKSNASSRRTEAAVALPVVDSDRRSSVMSK